MSKLQNRLIFDIENRCRDLRISVGCVLAVAGISLSTWWRWKSGALSPRVDTIARIEEALNKIERERNP